VLAGWSGDPRLALLGEVPRRLPPLSLPLVSLRALEELAAPALALALVGMTEVVSIGRSLAARSGRPLHADRELLAQGAANLASAFFACLPSSVSWTRSAVSLEAGARTPLSVIVASLTVAAVVLAAAPLARFVPLAAVAGVVLWIAVRMVRPEVLARMRRADRADFAVLVTTAVATLVMPLPLAVFSGVVLSLGLVVSRASLLHVSELCRTVAGHLVERPVDGDTGKDRVTLLQLEGDLFFGVAEELEARLDAVAANGARGLVLRVRRTHALDGAAAEALVRFVTRFRAGGGEIALCGLHPALERRVRRAGLAAALGPRAIFEPGARPFAALERAFAAVQHALGDAPGLHAVRAVPGEEDTAEPAGWSI
jgi:SulP family sulfate permease